MEKLGSAFEQFYFIPGNHDIYHRTRRDFTSVEIGRNVKNLTIVNNPTCIGNVGLVPWLINDEWKQVKKMLAKILEKVKGSGGGHDDAVGARISTNDLDEFKKHLSDVIVNYE
jgi:oligoribonuclease NrnB/cAMP/cGMP phosphodiesterase (DHH superfamily)